MKLRHLIVLAAVFAGPLTTNALALDIKSGPNCPGPNMRSLPSNEHVNVLFQNTSRKVQQIYWVDFNGNTQLYKGLAPGENFSVSSYSSHVWIVVELFAGLTNRGCNYWTSLPPFDQTVTIR